MKDSDHNSTRLSNLILDSLSLQQLFSTNTPNPVGFVDTVTKECIQAEASDILFEPTKKNLKVRVRIDGVLYKLGEIDLEAFNQISARIKVLSKLDPTEKRRIQEGQFTLDLQDRSVNLRVEIAQTIYGELIVIRIHERKTILMELGELGFSDDTYQTYWNMFKQRGGLILVCGPTGCGKTTTLYSTLNKLNKEQNYNVMTIEDPVEFQLEGVNQMQTEAENGFTFADGLKTILRLSPDIVLVGEIRDRETAQIAVESGLSGHLVLSTIHAEDSVGALFRLRDLGIEPYLLNSSLIGTVAQRLVRKICQNCKHDYIPSEEEKELFAKTLNKIPERLFRGSGCQICKNLSFRGRIGIYEVLAMNSYIRDLIRKKANEEEVRESLTSKNFITLLKDGLIKCEQGTTTVDEVLRNSFVVF